jgi:hypothetical protein
VNLSESYKGRMMQLSGILSEATNVIQYEYQVRDIGGDVFYKRASGEVVWHFTDELDFLKNSNTKNVINWKKPKDKESFKIKQIEVDQELNYKNNSLETYKRYLENVCPSTFKVEISGDSIKISEL